MMTRHAKYLVAAALLALPLAACEEGTKPPALGDIEGQVVVEGAGIDGVSVTLSSGAATTTGGGGYYSFTEVAAGTYTITISGFPADASFDATTAEVTIAQADQTISRNFSGSWVRTASLMGMVTVEGEGLPGVTVSISGRQEAQMLTDANGQYTFTGLRAGNYTVEISGYDATDVAFASTSSAVSVAVGESKVWSFDGTFVRESAISGQVSVEGNGLSGVTVSLRGQGADDEQTTDAGGQYTFSNLRAGEYQLAISGYDTDEYGFSTTSATIRVEHGRTANVPFEGILLRTAGIMGRVSVEGEGLADVMVSLSGEGENQSTRTNNSGQYSFDKLPAGNFQVGISGYNTSDYSFETTSKNVALALGETASVPFEGALLRTSGIAGRVSVDGMGLADVTVTLTGGDLDEAMTTMTDASGQYAIAGLVAGDYTVAISGYDAVEYSFTDSQDVTLGKDDTEIVNFMGKKLRTAAVAVMVTADGDGVAGVRADLIHVTNLATLSGSVIASGATGADGGHTFGDLLAGTYAVQISGADEEIDFLSTTMVSTVATDETGMVAFEGKINRTASIGGSVMVDGAGMAGVMVALSGGDDAGFSSSMETGDGGAYGFIGLRRGAYTVTMTNPDEAMYNFPTTSRDVSLGVGQAQSDVSFAGSQVRTSSISGQVSVEGDALEGVVVTLGGAMAAADTTGADGLYSFLNLGSGSYTVSMANPNDAAYIFESMSMDLDLGNSDNKSHDFAGKHTREASISGMLFVDEGTKNNMQDEGEPALMAAGVEVALVGPGLLDRTTAMTDEMGAFAFSDLRAGSYQIMPAAPAAAVMDDYLYGGAASYDMMVGVGADGGGTQDLPYDITHQTINFTINLKSGDAMGDALPGATVTLSADAAGTIRIATAKTGEDGMASIRFARAGTVNNTVHAAIAAPEGDYHAAGGRQAVTWKSPDRMTDAANAGNIVNLKADFSFSGAMVKTEFGGGKALGGWAIGVSSDKSAAANTPAKLGADGSAKYAEVVAADSLPVAYKVKVASNQDNKLDGGATYAADSLSYTHTGLSLPATMDAGMLEVSYTTQTLKVYVHEEKDQVRGYTGNILAGDQRMSGMVDVGIRYIADNGRSRAFPTEAKIRKSDKDGVVTFTNVPADQNVIVTAGKATNAGDIMILQPDELAAYEDMEGNGIKGGAFGAEGGFHHTVELCPLMRVAPNGQEGDCGSFAFVKTFAVTGQAWKYRITKDRGEGFNAAAQVGVAGTRVTLDPVEGKNLAGEPKSFIALAKPVRTRGENAAGTSVLDETKQFDFGQMATGVYALGVPAGWVADKAKQFTLDAAINIDVTPTTSVVYGVVTDGSGFAVDSASVTVNGKSTTTDAQGRYIVADYSSAAGPARTRFANKRVAFISATKGGFEVARDTIEFAANAPAEVDLDLDVPAETATLSGTVTMAGSGAAVAGAVITVDGDPPLNAKGAAGKKKLVTGADGSFSAVVAAKPAGTLVRVRVEKAGVTVHPNDLTYPALKGTTTSGISFTAHANATITGRVKDAGGRAMGGVMVKAVPEGGGAASDSMTTGNRGTFSLDVPPAFAVASHTIDASKDGYTASYPEAGQNVSGLPSGASRSFGDITMTEKEEPPSSDATLSALSLGDDVTLDPAFAADDTVYTAAAANNVTSVTVTAETSDDNANEVIMPVDADTLMDGHQVNLPIGDTDITATVTAEDSTTKTYKVTVTRDAAEVTLSASPDPIAEGGEATVTATVDHAQADEFTVTVDVGDFGTLSTNKTLTFAEGATTSTGEVKVTAPDNDTVDTSGLTVTLTGTSSDTTMTVDSLEVDVTDDEFVASAPRNLEVTLGDTDGTATVAFDGPGQLGSAAVDSFTYQATATGGTPVPATPAQATPVSLDSDADGRYEAELTGLTIGVEYTFSVFAVTSLGHGKTATTTLEAKPGITMALAATLQEDQSDTITVTIGLSVASAKDVTVTVATDDAKVATVDNATVTIPAGQVAVPATTDAPTIVAVQNDEDDGGTAVTFDVSAKSDNGRSPVDTEVTIEDDDSLPGAPTGLTATAESGGLLLAWVFNPTDWGNAPAASRKFQYRVKKTADGAFEDDDDWNDVAGGDVSRAVRVTGLDAEAYQVEVRAVTAAGESTIATGTGTPTG